MQETIKRAVDIDDIEGGEALHSKLDDTAVRSDNRLCGSAHFGQGPVLHQKKRGGQVLCKKKKKS